VQDHDNEVTNKSGNTPFTKVLEANLTRRNVLKGGLAASVATFLPATASAGWHDFDKDDLKKHWRKGKWGRKGLMSFTPVAVEDGSGPMPAISPDYQYDVILPWGDPIEPSGPEYSYPPSAADQEKQMGIGHDGMAFFPMKGKSNKHGMLAINHEFGTNPHVLGKSDPESLEDVRVSQHAHGVAVVELKKHKGQWKTVNSDNARRIHVNTPVAFSGPAAGSNLLKTPNGNVPLGTVNNCSSGATPWGTYLTCEENFNGYFGATNMEQTWTPSAAHDRYGFSEGGFGYGWQNFDRRFDLSDKDYVNEENRFGWVVEIDPFDGTQKPVKRTALGRVKHEGATTVIGKGGRAVVYMGDDQRFDYIYKFVSAGNYRRMIRQGKSPLDEGTLYVARFDENGKGEWLELSTNNPLLSNFLVGESFASDDAMENILVFTRMAADVVGATPMDRPEWTTVDPEGWTYCTLTNNSKRTEANAANPLVPNNDGHIIRWKDSNKFTGVDFEWDIFLIAEETHDTEDTFSDPDGLWADPDGRLFIETDGGQKDGLNNQLLVADTKTKEIRRLFTGVTKDEITGLTMTPDRRTMFINTQHPGNGDPTLTNFPAEFDGVTIPRDCTIVITRKDGGIIGS